MRRPCAATTLVLLPSLLWIACNKPQQKTPNLAYDGTVQPSSYPLSQSELLAMRDRQDKAAIRKHAWALFSEITKPTSNDPSSPPVWDTWIDEGILFSSQQPSIPKIQRSIQIPMEVISQAQAVAKNDAEAIDKIKAFLSDDQRRVGTETEYNPNAADHLRHEAMLDPKTLKTRAATFDNLHAPMPERNIAPFPSSAIIVKAAWRTVGPTLVQSFVVWDPPDPNRSDCQSGCARLIKVKLAAPGQPCNHPSATDEPFLSSCFYQVPDPKTNGYVLLLFGLHVITKEMADWTWSTFWWQPEPDTGQYAQERPPAPAINSVWRNYVMDTTLSMLTPPEGSPTPTAAIQTQHCRIALSDTAKICFNPFIERSIDPNGPVSNCMTCHRMAAYPALQPDARGAAQRGYVSSDDVCFSYPTPVMKVDYVWKLSPIANDSKLGKFLSTLQAQLQIQ